MRRSTYAIIALISLTLIPLELTWTRIFSAEFFYTFAFLVLSLAILGLGFGGLSLRLFRALDRDALLGPYLTLAGVCAVVGPPIVFTIGLDFSAIFSSWAMAGKILLTVVILMSAYFFGGMALAMLFKRNHARMPRLYMADLLGAGVGVVLGIVMMNVFGTPAATVLVALPVLLAAILTFRGMRRLVPVAVAALVIAVAPSSEQYLEVEREERAPVIYKHWDAMSKLKVYDYGEQYRGINIDNVANSPVYAFDGNWEDVRPGETQWSINVSYLIQQFDSATFLSLGAGGGSDVLQALAEGATEVHAVEINPHINYMMTVGDPGGWMPPPPPAPDTTADSASAKEPTDSLEVADSAWVPVTLAEFSGGTYNDPRVEVVTEDARAYVRRFENKFDVIYSLSSNTWAALASGSFALAENYLFTVEAFEDYWTALSDSGFMMMEHQMYVPRLVTEVMTALERQGVVTPTEHFAVYNLPQMRRKIILVSKQPLTDSLRYYALGPLTDEKFGQIHLLYPPTTDSTQGNQIQRIVERGWRSEADSANIDISPVSDDRPFVAQLGLWRNLTSETLDNVRPYAEFTGFPLSKLVMLIILAVVVVIVLPLNLLPYFRPGPKLRAIPWLYFFTIGVAFMAVEIILIQKYALLIGPSLYSLATVLLVLLAASALGSRVSTRVSDPVAFLGLVGWLLLDALVFKHLIPTAGELTLLPRMLVTALLIAPLGFFMGMPFPKATLRVGELIDWGFAVNGAASVLGSILVLLAAFAWGFTAALTISAGLYLLAYLMLRQRSVWHMEPPIASDLTRPKATVSAQD